MTRCTIANLGRPRNDPDYYRRQIEHAAAKLAPAQIPAPAAKPARQPRKPTEAELEYERVYLAEAGFDPCRRVVAQWPARWPIQNGMHHYTPDFSVWRLEAAGWQLAEVHEVDGGFKRATGKQRDSRVLFDGARTEYAWLGATWIWAERRSGGGWTVDRYEGRTDNKEGV